MVLICEEIINDNKTTIGNPTILNHIVPWISEGLRPKGPDIKVIT